MPLDLPHGPTTACFPSLPVGPYGIVSVADVAGDAAKSWGADLPGSPVMAANDHEERMTVFFVWMGKWSDGTRAPM